MQYQVKPETIEAVQITNETFYANTGRVPGVVYDPVEKSVAVSCGGAMMMIGWVGDWIVTDHTGTWICLDEDFKRFFEPVEITHITIQEKLKAIAKKDGSKVSDVEALAKRKAEEYHIPYNEVVGMLYDLSLGLTSALCDP